MAYPLVQITNSVPAASMIDGTVSYMSCSGDSYILTKKQKKWTATSRGICLVTEITATVTIADDEVAATSYTSSGTSYSEFAVISKDGLYQVTRVVS